MEVDPFNDTKITFLELARVLNKTQKTVDSWKRHPERNPNGLPWAKAGSTSYTTQEVYVWWSQRNQRQVTEG